MVANFFGDGWRGDRQLDGGTYYQVSGGRGGGHGDGLSV